jgi:hypothetical protein
MANHFRPKYVDWLFLNVTLRLIKNSWKEPTRYNRVVEFIIPLFLNCSTCFGRQPAHHQELKNCNAASGFRYVFGCRPLRWLSHRSGRQPKTYVKPEAALQFLSSWWCVVCSLKHVEQINTGIINSSTRLHLVVSFYEIYIASALEWYRLFGAVIMLILRIVPSIVGTVHRL